MTTKFTCPGCNSTVIVPDRAAAIIGPNEELGCGNTDEHDDPLVMWKD